MRRLLLGLFAVGWIGCAVEPVRTAPEAELEVSTLQEVAAPDSDAVPQFNQCLAGASCVFDDACPGASTNVPCGVGKHCCNPIGCAGICEPATFCTAGNQFIDSSAICPNGGKCCITIGISIE